MDSNLLKKAVDSNCEDFLKKVFPGKSKPEWNALLTLFTQIVTGHSTLVTDLSRLLRKDASAAEAKRTQELVSEWLIHYDFVEETGGWLLKNIPVTGLEGLTFAIDFSDISKVFGGRGMEGMAMGWDGSMGEPHMGHDFVCVSLVGAAYPEALPVYVKLGRGRKSKDELLGEAISAVMRQTGGRGWIVEDRGMDGAEHIWTLKRDGRRAAIRIRDMRRDVFGDGLPIDESLKSVPFSERLLHVHKGDRKAKVRFRPGVLQYCADPRSKDAETHDVRILVIESRLDGKSIYIYAVCPDGVFDDPAEMLACAVRAAQAYCDRWQIETSFYVMKQEFALERARVRKFRRLENIFSLCVLAYVYATQFLRKSRGFRKILKFLSDNLETVSMKTHALLAGIRALAGESRIRFISGRPRKPPSEDKRQMTFAGL